MARSNIQNKKRTSSLKTLGLMPTDILPTEIEPGVQKIVNIFCAKGLFTYMSCQGHLGHKGSRVAWVEFCPEHFNSYIEGNLNKLENFLKCGEGLWFLRVEYVGQSRFAGIGRPRPRIKSLKRIVQLEMRVTLHLRDSAFLKNTKQKTTAMKALEGAAKKYL